MQLLDGKHISDVIQQEITEEVKAIVEKGGKAPHLAAVLVGNDGASETYVKSKIKACSRIGFQSTLCRFDENISEQELLEKIKELNDDEDIHGILVQLPLPNHISVNKVIEFIDPLKDVDGFHPVNVGNMVKNLSGFLPATPYGILMLLERYKIETEGKHCVVIGRSDIVGKPMSILLGRNKYPGNATVTVCHSKTKNLKNITLQADIIVAALGKAEFLKGDMIKEGAVVIDVGITRVEDTNKASGFALKGDVDFADVSKKCSYITPVPGGVGPMTIAGLLKNTLRAAKRHVSEAPVTTNN